ncbi:MAG TPA: hypothetical protein VE010_12595, partial [Thermoanaerobaculia bacterium]|nr:hypothetical protein [Thermoanaerobaculia bacterium]
VTSRTPGVIIERTELVSPTAALVTLSVRADAAPGAYLLDLRNPDGGITAQGTTLLVYPRESIGAPLGVTAAAIVFPRTGTMVATDEAVYARGLLATTGTGTIIGEWRLDGVAFDLFTAVVSAGMPTEVRSHAPIPQRVAGASRLELVVTSPQLAISPAITVVHAIDTASRLQLYEPRDGTVVARAVRAPLFRWSLVPGVSGYEVEVFENDTERAFRFRTAQAEWRPVDAQLAEIGHGIRRWRVRPVFPGEARGEPARWQRFVLLPERIALQLDATELDARGGSVRWSGGTPGLIYRIEFVDPATGDVTMSALSLQPEYRVPRALAAGLRGHDVRVVALTPEGRTLSTTTSRRFARVDGRSSELFRVQSAAAARLTAQEPAAGGEVTTERPRIGAQWSGAVPAEQVALVLDTTDVTAVSTITPTSITYDALLPLAPGPHTVRMSAGELTESWTFTVTTANAAATPAADTPSDTPAAPAPADSAAPAEPGLRRDWALTPVATISTRSGEEQDTGSVQLSTQADLAGGALSSKFAGDVSFRHPLEGDGDTVQESQNWLMTFGGRQGGYSEQLTAGYAVPEFLDQTQFLTFGAARGGASGKVGTPFGTLSAFTTFESPITGVVAGSFAPVQKVRAYAYEAPTNTQRFLLRAIGMDVDEEPGLYTNGGSGDSFGVFGRYTISPWMNVVAEAARASFTTLGALEPEREGNALRFGVNGMRGRIGYQLNLRRTDAGYLNPADRGFTPGSVSDRQGGDLSLTAMFGRTSLSVTARHLTSGGSSESLSPDASENGLTATLSSMFGEILTVS